MPMPSPQQVEDKPGFEWTAVALAGDVARLEPGSLAELRRAAPDGTAGAPTFWRLNARWRLEEVRRDETEGWMVFLQALAILTPSGRDPQKRSAHDASKRLGRMLHEAGYSELRFARLIAATPAMRRELILRACRMLARQDVKVDVRALARLILDGDRKTLRALARDYYAAFYAAERPTEKEPTDA